MDGFTSESICTQDEICKVRTAGIKGKMYACVVRLGGMGAVSLVNKRIPTVWLASGSAVEIGGHLRSLRRGACG